MRIKKYVPYVFGLFLLALGIIFLLHQESNTYYTLYSSSERILYLKSNSYFRFFTSSTLSIENSLFYSFLLIIGQKNYPIAFTIYSYLISIGLYFCIAYISFRKSLNMGKQLLILFIAFVVSFLGAYGDALETKLIFIGALSFYLTQNINKTKTKAAVEILIVIFFYSIAYPFIYLIRFIKGKNTRNLCMFIISVFFGGLLLRVYAFGFAYESFLEAMFTSFIYNPWIADSNVLYASGIVLGIVFISLLAICLQQNKQGLIWIGIYVLIVLYALVTSKSTIALTSALRIYISFGIMLYYAFNHKLEFIFDIRNIIFIASLCILILGIGTVITHRDSGDDFAYRMNYDYSYSKSKEKREEKTGIDYSSMYDFLTKLELIPEYNFKDDSKNKDFTQENSVLYGFSVVQDATGSRWASNMSAVELYCANGERVAVSMYNPEDRVGTSFDIVIDNEIKYQGITEFGPQTVVLPVDEATGNHIIKLIVHVPENQKFGIYITNIFVVE